MSIALVSDEELIAQVRAGETEAYGQLFARHHRIAKKVAITQLARRSSADDVVADAFARVLTAIQAGHGPNVAFRPYLLTTVRRACIDHGRTAARETPVDSFADDELQFDPADDSSAELERSLAARAYRELPERWRAVLWYSEIEQLKPSKYAPMMGLSANAAAALAVRAREGLRDAYVQAHLERDAVPACQPTVERLGQYLRGSLSDRDTAHVDEHLDSCGRCSALYTELQDSAGGLRAVIGVLILGAAAAKWLRRGAAVTWIKTAGPRAQAAVAGTTAAAVVAGAVIVASTNDPEATRRNAIPARNSNPSIASVAPNSATRGSSGSPRTASSPATSTTPTTRGPGDRPLVSSQTSTSVGSSATTIGGQGSTSTPTTAPAPNRDTALGVRVESLGDLVRTRQGMLAVSVLAQGPAPAAQVRLDITLDAGGSTFLDADAPGWMCDVQPTHTICDRTEIQGATASSLYVRVTVPSQLSGLGVTAKVATSSQDFNAADNSVRRVMPVWRSGLAPRFVTRDTGDVLTVGNSVLTCDATAVGCDAAQQSIGSGASLTNDGWKMVPIDTDADPSTATSSAASLSVPAGSDVLFAGLYWGGNLVKGAGGRAGNANAAGAARIAAPGRGAVSVSAAMFERNAGHYQGFADVTTLVRQAGSGNYTVGGVEVATGLGSYGGWSLVVVVRDIAKPMRNLAVYDGMDLVTPQSSAHMMFGAISERARRTGEMSMVLYDGDAGVTGDSLSFDGMAISDARNPSNDFANSTIDRGLTRAPAQTNGFGLDIDRVTFLTGSAWTPAATVRANTTSDRFTIGVLTLCVPV